MHEASSMTGVVELTVVRVSGSVDGRAGGGVGRVLGASYLRALRLVRRVTPRVHYSCSVVKLYAIRLRGAGRTRCQM